jgi:hypothetical protein
MGDNSNKPENLGNGITAIVNGDTLTLTVKLSKPGTPSSSGKTMVHASSRGNIALSNGMVLGLNVYSKKS